MVFWSQCSLGSLRNAEEGRRSFEHYWKRYEWNTNLEGNLLPFLSRRFELLYSGSGFSRGRGGGWGKAIKNNKSKN